MSGSSGFGASLGWGKKRENLVNSGSSSPYFQSTPYSSISGTRLNLDPSIRSLQETALGSTRGMMGNLSQGFTDYLGKANELRGQLVSNRSPYLTARINPVAQAGATAKGELQRNIGMRQIGGSSFANQALSNLDFETAKQIGDASAIANAENLAAITGLDKDVLSALIGKITLEAQLNGESLQVAQQRLQQELASFGLGTRTEGSATSTGTAYGATISYGGAGNTPTPYKA